MYNQSRISGGSYMSYVSEVYQTLCDKYPDEPEFLMAVNEVLNSIEPIIKASN